MKLSYILNHLGEDREKYFNAVSPPIIQTSNFRFENVADFRKALSSEIKNPLYTRGNNPTVEILRKKIAALEKAEDALIFASGSAAISSAVIANVNAGDHIICVESPYSWTHKLLTKFLSRFGVTHTFVDGRDISNIEKAIRKETRVLYLESPNSMTFELQDLKACSELAKANGIITICDNSYCSPYFQNPIDLGIDIVVHSGTKYLNGHSDIVAGVLCGSSEMIYKIFDSEFMTLGGIISPNDAWLMIRGLRTLPIRIERSQDSCIKIVNWLKEHKKITEIYYPYSENFSQKELVAKQMRGSGGLFSIKVAAEGISQVENFIDALDRFFIAASWGGHESLAIPICGLYGVEGKDDPSLPWNLVRLYIGLEDPHWLIEDLEKALSKI